MVGGTFGAVPWVLTCSRELSIQSQQLEMLYLCTDCTENTDN